MSSSGVVSERGVLLVTPADAEDSRCRLGSRVHLGTDDCLVDVLDFD
jgi:hypothetical protein